MYIRGCVPFRNKKERKQIWKELKQEFGENIKIIIEDKFMNYSCKVDRNHHC